jgi:outer membrane protein OmpA-like peptidoglycan-associated protein
MSTSITEILNRLVSTELAAVSAQIVGEKSDAAARGLASAVTSLLHGLEDKSSDARAMEIVADLANAVTRDPAGLDDVKGLLAGGAPTSTAAVAGNRLLGLLFGAEQSSLVDLIAHVSGLRLTSAASLLSLAAPMVLAAIGRRLGGGALTGPALAGLIGQERQSLLGLFSPPGAVHAAAAGAVTSSAATLAHASKAPSHTAVAAAAHTAHTEPGRHLLARLFAWLIIFMIPVGIGFAYYWQTVHQGAHKAALPEKIQAPATSPPASVAAPQPAPAPAPPPVPTPAPAPAKEAAPLPEGMARIALAGGTQIEAARDGVETKVIEFITDPNAVIDKGKWFDFDRLNFETGSTALTAASRAQIANIVAILKAYPAVEVKIGGYTDNVGDRAANLALSDKRARAVRDAIIAGGIDAKRVDAEGYGDKHPIADNATEAGRAKNRRTAISVRAK